MWTNKSAIAAACIALISYSGACAADDVQAARAVVTGPENRVHEFHQNLLGFLSAFLGSSDAAATAVSCDLPRVPPEEFNCNKLNPEGRGSAEAVYTFFRDHIRLEALILSWDKLQTRDRSDNLKISFDMDFLTEDCGGIQVCVSAPFCPGPPVRCDKVKGPPCTACTSP